MMSTLVGLSGARRNACAAICVDGQIRAACEQERLTRVRGVGLDTCGLPEEAIDEVVALAGCASDDVTGYVLAESPLKFQPAASAVVLDHHEAHAATAYLTSPFNRAAVLVCDSHPDRELSVWMGDGGRLRDQAWPWRGPAFARLYSDCATLFALERNGNAHRLETLAHLGRGDAARQLEQVLGYSDGGLQLAGDWRERITQLIRHDRGHHEQPIEAASAVQRRIGELLLELVADIRKTVDADVLCLSGGLFFNTYFNTIVRTSGIFEDVFVPINPGNAGLSVGATLMVARQEASGSASPQEAVHETEPARSVSPFLGPEFDSEAIKAALDGCKLAYEFVSETEAIDAAVVALARGQLVAWFQGRMEWGPRALGHRSILADPRSPYVLDNLNFFLRKRDRSRPFGVSACRDRVPELFCGPPVSPFMEYEYTLRSGHLQHVVPSGARSIRVQTVTADNGMFWTLHERLEQATGSGVLVNTSFNGFHEPIVCSPRDAIRVFYGTGLDILIMGRFILRK